jgi:hypothetical protein
VRAEQVRRTESGEEHRHERDETEIARDGAVAAREIARGLGVRARRDARIVDRDPHRARDFVGRRPAREPIQPLVLHPASRCDEARRVELREVDVDARRDREAAGRAPAVARDDALHAK